MIKFEGKKFLSDERLEIAFRSFIIKEKRKLQRLRKEFEDR